MNKRAVVAVGGNAITGPDDTGEIAEQFANTRRSLEGIVKLIREGWELVITHGNGPQIGNALIRVEEGSRLVPVLPLGVLVADLQGGIGYMIGQSLQNRLHRDRISKSVATVLTQVIVESDDPSLKNPTKPIGPYFSGRRAGELERERGWSTKRVEKEKYRRVVPSPHPSVTVERETIRSLLDAGNIVIACGGGGIPVYVEDDGTLEGVDAVIDKDKASALLASEINADLLVILTGVPKVFLDFESPDRLPLDKVSLPVIERYYNEGHFPEGSMGPKIEASIDFLKSRGGEARVLITSFDRLPDGLEGRDGTLIIND